MFSTIKKALQKRGRCLSVCILLLSGGAGLQPAGAQNINTPNKMGPLGTQVNTASGNLFLPRNDMFIVARALDIDLTFYYNSFNYNVNAGFGNGWSFTYGMNYRIDSTGAVIVTWDDGREDIYTPSGSGFNAPAGIFDRLTQYSSGKYLLQSKFGVKYYFDNSSHRHLTRIEDLNSNYLNFTYSDTLLTGITSTAGQSITLSYTAGNLSSMTDAIASPSRTYTYSYDALGNLTTVTDPLNNKIKYTYLIGGPLAGVTDKNANTADIIYFSDLRVSELVSCNTRKSFSYDTATHATTITDYVPTGANQITSYFYTFYNGLAWLNRIHGNCCGYDMTFDFDNNGNVIKQTDGNGNISTYTYDSRGNLLTITDPLNHTSSYTYSADYSRVTGYTDRNGNVYAVTYDSKGNPLQSTEPGNGSEHATYSATGDITSLTDANGNTYNYTYDAYGNITQISGPLNYALGLAFNARGILLSITDPRGNSYATQYDVMDRLTGITDPLNHSVTMSYDANNNLKIMTDENNHASNYIYDASDRLVTFTDAAGNQSRFEYDAMDNPITYKDPAGKTTRYMYDSRNRLSAITDPLGNIYNYSFDANGNIVALSLPDGNTVTAAYDKLDRPVNSSDGGGSVGALTYDANGNIITYTNGTGTVTTYTYDGKNRISRVTDALGNYTSYTYDNNDNILLLTDMNGQATTYTYDARNRVKSVTDANGNMVKATYDAAGNLATLTDQKNNVTVYSYDALERRTGITYADGKVMSYTYDNKGGLISRKMPDGSVISYQYDAIDRPVGKILPNNNTFTYTYDAKGRLVTATNSEGVITAVWDDLDRLVSETFNGHTTTYSYNVAARTQTITYPDGSTVTRNFDIRERLTGIAKGSVTLASMQYNAADQLLQTSYGNGVSTIRQYDFNNRLTYLSTAGGSIQNLSFSYDNNVNITSVSRPDSAELYSYDPAHRLIDYKKGATVHHTYAYDAVGNRTSVNTNGIANTYTVNNLNQYTTLTNGSGTVNFTYDGNGNQTFDGTATKTYDAEGKLISETSGAGSFSYAYDAVGRRVQKVINGRAIKYYYSGLMQIEQRSASNDTLMAETVYNKTGLPVYSGLPARAFYYHSNDLSSVEALTTTSGRLVEKYGYEPYGKTTIYDSTGNLLPATATGNRFGFTGQEYDAETSAYHFHYRNYNPGTGSFAQRDPINYGDGMGIYQYVHDNPRNFVDPLGLQPCPPKDAGEVKDASGDLLSHGGNIVNLLGLLKQVEEHAKYSRVNVSLQLINIHNAIDKYQNDQTLSEKDRNILGGEIEFNIAGLAGDLIPAGTPNPYLQAYKRGMGVAGKIDAASQELTGRSLSSHYAHLDDGAIDFANKALRGSQKRYDRDEAYLRANEKVNGTDRTKWSEEAIETYERHQRATRPVIPGERIPPPNPGDCPPNGPSGGTQKPPPGPGNGGPGAKGKTNVKRPEDPNEIIGPQGVDAPKWVSISAVMPYTINYENSAAASAPAKTVRIEYPIDPKQDINTFSLGSFGFNSLTFPVPPNTASLYERVSALDSLGLYVDVTAGLDVMNHKAFWTFQAIDPVTLLPPSDPLTGFLLLQDPGKPTSGHAYVNFFIKPLTTDVTGDTTHAIASIIFDVNDRIPTNVAKNTIDAVAPVSHIGALPSTTNSKFIHLTWSAADDANGSGVGSFTLYASQNGGSYAILGSGITHTDTTITGVSGNSYTFFVLATDKAGNTEALRPDASQTTFVDYTNPTPLPVTWLYFKAANQGADNLLNWATASEQNTRTFEVERSVDGKNFTVIGTVAAAGVSTKTTTYSHTDKNATALNVNVIYYRLKQTDKDGKYVYSAVVVVNMPLTVTGPIVKAYPNPFRQTLNVMIAGMPGVSKDDVVEIYSVDGRLLYQKKVGQRLANELISLSDLPDLKAGSYLLKATLSGKIYSFKLVKQ